MSRPEALNYQIQQANALLIIGSLLEKSGIRPSAGMIMTNHPALGGGIKYALDDPSNNETCVLVDGMERTNLWEQKETIISQKDEQVPVHEWQVKKPEEVIEWLKDNSELTKCRLREPTVEELRKVRRFS